METFFGIELGFTSKAIIALILVLLLIAIAAWVIRQVGGGRIGSSGGRNRQQRLAVLDSADVDARRRLVLIRRDNVEHLILIGGPTDVVIEPNIVRAQPASGAPRPGARPGGYEQEGEDASIVPYDVHEPERSAPAPAPARPPAPGEPPRTMPRAPQRVDPQYADMAQRLEAALRKPAAEPAPQQAPAPRAPETRAPEPRVVAPEPRPATPPAPTPRAPMPRVPEPRVEPRVAEAPTPRVVEPPRPQPAQAPQVAKQEAADIFGSLEEEMASLLRPQKKDNK